MVNGKIIRICAYACGVFAEYANMQYTAAKIITSEGICFLPVPYLFQSPKGFEPGKYGGGTDRERIFIYISEKTKNRRKL